MSKSKKSTGAPTGARLVKTIIYKVWDADEKFESPRFFTFRGLENFVINELWPDYDNVTDKEMELSQADLCDNQENIFLFLQLWNHKVERILVTDLI